MKFQYLIIFAVLVMLFGCEKKKQNLPEYDDLNSVKKKFLNTIFLSEVEEGPFNMQYTLKTIFFSKDVISLFGEINVYDCMPHGWKHYEGRLYIKIDGQFKEIFLNDLFTSISQKEFLRSYCENDLKKHSITYFGGKNPLKTKLELEDIRTFVIDDQFLIIIFQPYVAVSSADGPFVMKIPFDCLKGQWDSGNILFPLLQKIVSSRDFISSNEESF